MRAWRIVRRRWGRSAFDGEGARRAGGRWNHKGTPIAYASGSLSLAALELFVNLDSEETADDLVSVGLHVPDNVIYERIDVSQLPPNWREYPASPELKDIGTDWIRLTSTLLLQVPSVVVPHEWNVLVNPVHPDFRKCTMGDPEPFYFDPRMWKQTR